MAMDRGDEDSISVAVQQLTGGEPFRIAIAATGTLAEFKRLVHERQSAADPDGQRLILGGPTGTPLAEDEEAKLSELGIGDGTIVHLGVQDAQSGRQRREAREAEREAKRRLREGYAAPPRQDNPIHPDAGGYSFFWRYADFCECLPCGYGSCCYALWCGACAHGEIQRWASGRSLWSCLEWCLCPLFISCMVEGDRKAIEAKIHTFHKQRGDKTAPERPPTHEGVACVGIVCGGGAIWIMHAQNIFVMRKFKEVQKEHLQADEP